MGHFFLDKFKLAQLKKRFIALFLKRKKNLLHKYIDLISIFIILVNFYNISLNNSTKNAVSADTGAV